MDEIIDYIKLFLVYGNLAAADRIGYTANESEWSNYKLVIVPGRNVLTGERRDWHEPDLSSPAQAEKQGEFTDEFGEKMGGTWVIREDIFYNTLFCISLAGEFCLNNQHDEHGRIASASSPLGRQNLRTIPVLDEYSRLCTKLVEASLPEPRFSNIVLTHDVDTIAHYRHLRGFLGGIRRGQARQAWASLSNLEQDSAYTFHWLHNQDSQVKDANVIYFLKATHGQGLDYPQYKLSGRDCQTLLTHLRDTGASIGLHGSYHASDELSYKAERQQLEQATHVSIHQHRNHYLRITGISALQAMADAGILDDYTIGWADHIGFRLGTTRPVRWINPQTMQLTELTLHPLSIMDCTLSNSNYMNISEEEEAYYTCQQLVDKVRQHGGELVLLWHNSNVIENEGYHRSLYQDLIQYLVSSARTN
ncbi:MAG: polysaccharide deacetylase family protein [Paludibacteraceae bacterium]|nr:polysaccharide deacetylase family protein [Paludibacteraceae bacterium]